MPFLLLRKLKQGKFSLVENKKKLQNLHYEEKRDRFLIKNIFLLKISFFFLLPVSKQNQNNAYFPTGF